MGCEKEYNGNYTVSIHKVYIDISQIIRILNFRYWFKRGTAMPRLSLKVVGNPYTDVVIAVHAIA